MKLLLLHNPGDPRFRFFDLAHSGLLVNSIEPTFQPQICDVGICYANLGFDYFNPNFSHLKIPNTPDFSYEQDLHVFTEVSRLCARIILYIREDGPGWMDRWFDYMKENNLMHRTVVIRDFKFSDKFLLSNKPKELLQDNGGYLRHLKKIGDALPESLEFTQCTVSNMSLNENHINDYLRVKNFTFRFHSYGWLGMGYEREISYLKTYDVFYVKRYRKTIDGYLRRWIESIIRNESNINSYLGPCDDTQYIDELCKSKLCIAPWGLGECVFDDWKASINGVILLRPRTDHVIDYYGIYDSQSNYALREFELSRASLLEQVYEILENYEYFSGLATEYAYDLRKTFTLERHIKDFVAICNFSS